MKEHMKASKEVWRDFLLQHYEDTRLSILKCRKVYRDVEVGIDHWSRASVLRNLQLPANAEGALRS
eukprot:5746822-Heterocapsa_arctica.AAC.1